MICYVHDIDLESSKLIQDTMNTVLGDGICSVETLTSSNVRSKVRLASKDINVFLVVLSETSTKSCKDIEDGLYESDKFFSYSGYNSLVDYLNTKFELDIPKKDNEVLTSVVSTSEAEVSNDNNENVEDLLEQIDYLKAMANNYKNINKELMERLNSSDEGTVVESQVVSADIAKYEEDKIVYESRISELEEQVSALETDLAHKDSTISNLDDIRANLSTKCDSLNDLVTNLNKSLEERVTKSEYDDAVSKISFLQEQLDSMESTSSVDISVYTDRITELEGLVGDRDGEILANSQEIARLTEENISLRSEIDRLGDDSISKGQNTLELQSELGKLRKWQEDFNNSVFGQIYNNSTPNSAFTPILDIGELPNLRFVFSATSEITRDVYKVIRSVVQVYNTSKFVFIDVANNSYGDYIFGVGSVTQGINWLDSGEGFIDALSKADIGNVSPLLLSSTHSINEGYFLRVDWKSRLEYLNSLGVPVIVYCGNLSSMVSRYLLSEFNVFNNKVFVVVGGQLVSLRNGIMAVSNVHNKENIKVRVMDPNLELPVINSLMNVLKSNCPDLDAVNSVSMDLR